MDKSQFDRLYKQLNKAQKQAVDTIDGPVMVVAGPGTGKTSILTLRIANILKETDTPANSILAITYTDAGVKSMRNKLQDIIGDRAHDIRLHTFHGFASSIIAEYPDHFIHINNMKQMTDIEQETLIRNIISDSKFSSLCPIGRPDAYLFSILRSIDDSKREAMTPDFVRQHAENEIKRIENDESSISTRGQSKGQLKADAKEEIEKCRRTILFADVYELYENKKREEEKLDFNDLIIELLLALRNDELLLRLVQEKYLYIHVDEHQDTNDAQNFIISIIAEFFETPNIFIVGDEKQAIYRFQGASVENFLLLQKKWPSMKLISLNTNYRSHQGILDASFNMIEKNYEENEHKDLRIRLSSGISEKTRPIDIVTGENVPAIESYLVKELKNISEKEPHSSVAIIVRRNRDLDRIIRLLESNNIAVSSERSIDIFNHPIGKLFFDFIEYIIDPSKIDLLAKTVISGMWNIDFEKRIEIIKLLKSGTFNTVDDLIPNLKNINLQLLSDSPMSFLIHIAEKSSFSNLIIKDPSYVYVWRGIVTLAETLIREGNINDPSELIEKMLAYRISAESRIVKVSVGAPDVSIQALTAHGSKGLEFDYVFIPYATEEAWIGKARGSSFVLPKKSTIDNDIRDIRRLFYVALTRAKRHITILTAREESDGKILMPIRFIEELNENNIFHTTLPMLPIEQNYHTVSSIQENIKNTLLNFTKQSLVDKGLSVTALNHFIKCPSIFIFQSILKLPQAPSVSTEKGTAMHTAFDFVWKLENKNIKNIENTMTETVMEYFNTSLLTVSEKELAKKELLESIPEVAKALMPHFIQAQNAIVFTEMWIKTEFHFENIIIPIHGKLDAVVDNCDEVSVYDYKTRQAMSVNAIKGETKNSDGNYFRQLVFYKILLKDDIRFRSKNIIPSLVFISPDEKGRCPIITLPIEDKDIEDVKKEIQLLFSSVWDGSIINNKCDDSKCEWCGMKNILISK